MTEQGQTQQDHHWVLTQQNITDIGELKEGQGRLETKQDGLSNQIGNMSTQFSQGMTDMRYTLQQSNKRESWVPLAALILTGIIILGGVLGFTFNTISKNTQHEFSLTVDNMQRESDYRFEEFNKAQSAMYDDLRRADRADIQEAYQNGVRDTKDADLWAKVAHLDEQNHVYKDRVADVLVELMKKMESVSALAGTNQRWLEDHTSRQGSQGHPVAERKISGNAAVNRVLPNQ